MDPMNMSTNLDATSNLRNSALSKRKPYECLQRTSCREQCLQDVVRCTVSLSTKAPTCYLLQALHGFSNNCILENNRTTSAPDHTEALQIPTILQEQSETATAAHSGTNLRLDYGQANNSSPAEFWFPPPQIEPPIFVQKPSAQHDPSPTEPRVRYPRQSTSAQVLSESESLPVAPSRNLRHQIGYPDRAHTKPKAPTHRVPSSTAPPLTLRFKSIGNGILRAYVPNDPSVEGTHPPQTSPAHKDTKLSPQPDAISQHHGRVPSGIQHSDSESVTDEDDTIVYEPPDAKAARLTGQKHPSTELDADSDACSSEEDSCSANDIRLAAVYSAFHHASRIVSARILKRKITEVETEELEERKNAQVYRHRTVNSSRHSLCVNV